jgi:hypothetical protein
MKRNQVILAGIVILIIGVAVTYPLWSPYFINDVVDEAFPDFTDAEREAIRDMPAEQQDLLVAMRDDNAEMANDTARAMMEDDHVMDDEMPADEPVVLSTGSFSVIDAVHNGDGTATIYQLPNGSRVLRFENFRVTNCPELHVILSPNAPDSIFGDVGDYVDLGQLSGNVGNQNYTIPDDANLADYQSIVIYCVPFHVVFSTASLTATGE